MTLDTQTLLAGPRGRGLLVHLFDDVAVRTLIMRADSSGRAGSRSFSIMASPATPGIWGMVDRARLRRERSRREQEMRRPVTPAEMAASIRAARVPGVGTAALVEALSLTVDDAKAWQPADGNESVLASTEVRAALTPLAELVAATEFAQTWAAPAQPHQWTLDRKDDRLGAEPVPTPAQALMDWREAVDVDERDCLARRDRGQAASGAWWSMPPGRLTRSTSVWPEFGPAGLYLEEDSIGPMAAAATPVGSPPEHTYEIADAESWARLCREYPVDVTASREVDWNQSVGHSDRWVIPDWQAMAADWAAVHLTIAGYLAAATTRVEVSDGTASVIAGWGPDENVWLRDVPRATSAAVEWRRYQQLGWRAETGPTGGEQES